MHLVFFTLYQNHLTTLQHPRPRIETMKPLRPVQDLIDLADTHAIATVVFSQRNSKGMGMTDISQISDLTPRQKRQLDFTGGGLGRAPAPSESPVSESGDRRAKR